MKWILGISLLASATAFAQPDAKTIKKEIPVKGVKEVKALAEDKELFHFITKEGNGIYDSRSKKILLENVASYKLAPFGKNILKYKADDVFGLIRLKDRKSLLMADADFKTASSLDTGMILLISEEIYGMFDIDRNDCYVISESNKPKKDVAYFTQEYNDSYEPYDRSATFNARADELVYNGFWSDGIQDYTSLFRKDGYIFESIDGYNTGTQVIKSSTAEQVAEFGGGINSWEGGYFEGYDNRTYYDQNFEVVASDVGPDGYTVEVFQKLFDPSASSVENISEYQYIVETEKGKYFFDMLGMEYAAGPFTDLYLIGQDVWLGGGKTYITRKASSLGVYNIDRGETVPALYRLVELNILSGGTYAYRADGEFFIMGYYPGGGYPSYKLTSRVPIKERELKTISPIFHASIEGDRLILSKRESEADTHDSQYYTKTNYVESSGIVNIKTGEWEVKPEYHIFQPFQDHYLASKYTASYSPTRTSVEILDKDFKPITTKKYFAPIIYEDKLYVENDKHELIQFDIESKKEVKNYGNLETFEEDFWLWSTHLLIGSRNYEDDKDEMPVGFDIQAILNRKGEVIEVDGYEFDQVIFDGMVKIVKYKMDGREYALDSRDQKIPEGCAVYDLMSKRILSPMYDEINIGDDQIEIVRASTSRELQVNPDQKIRYIDVKFMKLRTFYTTM